MDSGRTKIITEEVHELMCERCPFSLPGKMKRDKSFTLKCAVPLGTCAYRTIKGLPGHFVGDLLERAGLIDSGWDEGLVPVEEVPSLKVDVIRRILEGESKV